MQPLRHFVLAVQFFSRIPVTGRLAAWAGWSPQLQHASVAHLPGVGWLVGAWGAACLTATGWLLAPSPWMPLVAAVLSTVATDRKSTRLNSSHLVISYAVFCLK